jgi:hypothetical protein
MNNNNNNNELIMLHMELCSVDTWLNILKKHATWFI